MSKSKLRERLQKKRNELAKKAAGKGGIMFLKEGTKRVRVLPVGEDNEFAFEVTHFYLGNDIKGVFSPQTFGDPCAIMEMYKELKDSKDSDDKELAKKLVPKTKYLMPILVFDDLKGKKIDSDRPITLVQLTNGMYQSILDLYLDDDEWGDMTDIKKGYDLKLSREGTTITNTEYSVQPCKNTPIPKKYKKEIDLEELVKKQISTYEETKEFIEQFLGLDIEPKKKRKKNRKGKKSSKRRKRDL